MDNATGTRPGKSEKQNAKQNAQAEGVGVIRPTFNPTMGWLVGAVVSLTVCWLPGSLLLFVVAMSVGFSHVSLPVRWLVLVAALAVIGAGAYLLARTVKRALARD